MIFDGIHVCKTYTFDGHLQAGKQEEVCRSQIRRVRRVIKHSYHLLCQELAHTDRTAFEVLVNTVSAHGIPPVRLHLQFTCVLCSFPQFVAELDVVHVAPLHCDTTSHTDYVHLATVGLNCWSHEVHTVCRFSPCPWRTMCMLTHTCQVAVKIWHHSPNFLDTPCILVYVCVCVLYTLYLVWMFFITLCTIDVNQVVYRCIVQQPSSITSHVYRFSNIIKQWKRNLIAWNII